jgi:predicted Rossmann fold nucleotide-binding protein DprA/Smf involved in DNA uptake
MNSTLLLEQLELISKANNSKIDIEYLAAQLKITVPKLVSVLTELEKRDEIVIEITSSINVLTNQLEYAGTVELMRTPPDEI